MSLQQKNISLNYIYISIKDFCFFIRQTNMWCLIQVSSKILEYQQKQF